MITNTYEVVEAQETTPIAVWADGTWCDLEDESPEEYTHLSDDYMIVKVPLDEDIDEYLTRTRPQG